MEDLLNDDEDRPSQHKNGHRLCIGKDHHLLSLKESLWKPRQ